MGGLSWVDRWWVGSGCGLWVMVVSYGGGWVEMVMGGSVVVDGSTGDGRISGGQIGDGESVVVPIFILVCFYLCFSVLVVDLAAIVG